ncbi:cytochrome P450 2G1 isoform X2 [Columba livia]|uniref:cytochrome P450 2G1 isoform X2 n=1 Tax=Columba livia TaxID=8932 RepID=UPI0031BB5AA4
MAETLMQHMPGPHRRIPVMLGRMRRFIARRMRDNAATLQPRAPRDFIDCFLQHMEKEKSNLSSEFMLEKLELTTLNLFFAGTETVSSTLRYGFLMLMKHPHVQEKVHEEIDQVIGRDRAPTLEDRGRMPYTDAVIHEIQRCSDLIPLNVPHRVTRDIVFRGYFIPKDTDVYPLLSSVLHDPSVFKHPNAFDPMNFVDESGRFKRNDAFVPFSSGSPGTEGEGPAPLAPHDPLVSPQGSGCAWVRVWQGWSCSCSSAPSCRTCDCSHCSPRNSCRWNHWCSASPKPPPSTSCAWCRADPLPHRDLPRPGTSSPQHPDCPTHTLRPPPGLGNPPVIGKPPAPGPPGTGSPAVLETLPGTGTPLTLRTPASGPPQHQDLPQHWDTTQVPGFLQHHEPLAALGPPQH